MWCRMYSSFGALSTKKECVGVSVGTLDFYNEINKHRLISDRERQESDRSFAKRLGINAKNLGLWKQDVGVIQPATVKKICKSMKWDSKYEMRLISISIDLSDLDAAFAAAEPWSDEQYEMIHRACDLDISHPLRRLWDSPWPDYASGPEEPKPVEFFTSQLDLENHEFESLYKNPDQFPISKLVKAVKRFRLSPEQEHWVIFGEGGSEERSRIEQTDDPKSQGTVIQFPKRGVSTEVRAVAQVVEAKLPNARRVPLFTFTVAAGNTGRVVYYDEPDFIQISEDFLRGCHASRDLIALQIDRDALSMSPELRPYDTILVDKKKGRRAATFESGMIYCVALEDGSHSIKRIFAEKKRLILNSDNENKELYPDFPAWTTDLRKLVIGQVIKILPRDPIKKNHR